MAAVVVLPVQRSVRRHPLVHLPPPCLGTVLDPPSGAVLQLAILGLFSILLLLGAVHSHALAILLCDTAVVWRDLTGIVGLAPMRGICHPLDLWHALFRGAAIPHPWAPLEAQCDHVLLLPRVAVRGPHPTCQS